MLVRIFSGPEEGGYSVEPNLLLVFLYQRELSTAWRLSRARCPSLHRAGVVRRRSICHEPLHIMMPIVPILLLSVVGLSTCAWQPPAALLRTGSVGRSASQLRWHSSPVLQMAPLPDDELAQLIQKLRAVTPEELPKLLAENLKQIDQRLFIRLAEMSDAEQDDYEKLRIRQLATLVASSIETILDQADKQMSADAEAVQSLLRTMALDDGEFELPIPAAQLGALRNAIRSANPPLDEGFVGTVKAYMKKSDDDGLAGMVDVLRILLQTFAAERLRSLSAGSQVDADEGIQTALAAVLDVRALSIKCLQPSPPWAALLHSLARPSNLPPPASAACSAFCGAGDPGGVGRDAPGAAALRQRRVRCGGVHDAAAGQDGRGGLGDARRLECAECHCGVPQRAHRSRSRHCLRGGLNDDPRPLRAGFELLTERSRQAGQKTYAATFLMSACVCV